MNEHYYDEMVKTITSVTDRNQKIALKYTGLNKKGGSTLAYEFENTDSQARYFLKITANEDNGGGELRVLPKVNQVFVPFLHFFKHHGRFVLSIRSK